MRRSSRFEVKVYFQVLEWAVEVRRRWRLIYNPLIFMIVGGVRTSDIPDIYRICPLGYSNLSEFSWVGYIRWISDMSDFGGVRVSLEPD
jgi:hypothetical protein